METCKNCKWLINSWCDMKRSGRHEQDKRCSEYDSSKRRFDPQQFYKMCEDYCEMYNAFKDNRSYMKKDNELFNINECELLSYVLNDIQREIGFYKSYDLYEDLNNIEVVLSSRR